MTENNFDRILEELELDKQKFQPLRVYFVNITVEDMAFFLPRII